MPGIKLPLFFTGIALIAAGLANACNPNPADFFDQGRTSLTLELPENIESYSAEDCRACHPEDYEDWNDSMHARAFVDPIFQSAFRKEPAIWCVNCHAPLSQQAFTQTSGPYVVLEAEALEANDMQLNSASRRIQLRNEGINCAACHVRNGKILSSRPEYGPLEDMTPDGTVAVSKEGPAPHPTVYEPRLSTAEFCAGCHQFNFPFDDPAAIVHYGDEPMQNVYAEWSQHAGLKGISCQACHMSRDHHRLYGPHSPGWLSDRIQMH
ncbi:MAG: hypothetical protein KDK34_12060, partial [Leptospiraceae bacterium]|nr:hypothetical protein [Leptospiraceae bacterium]